MRTPSSFKGGPRSEAEAVQAVAQLWGDAGARGPAALPRGWLDSELVLREYVQVGIDGEPDEDWLKGLVRRLGLPPTGRWLSLGCGSAGAEIQAARRGFFDSMLALDVAARAIEAARRLAADHGVFSIEFGVVDFNHLSLAPGSFDVVLMSMSLHHVAALERVLRSVRSALKPDGHLLINEFVGPRQFQFPEVQLTAVRELLGALPERLRMDSTTGQLKSEYVRMPIEHWNIWDPSEAVRSDEIVSLLYRYFDVVYRRDYGGTILNLLLEHIVHNWDPGKPCDVELFRLLARTEALLIGLGVLANDFTVMAMRKPGWKSRVLRRLRSRRSRQSPHALDPLRALHSLDSPAEAPRGI